MYCNGKGVEDPTSNQLALPDVSSQWCRTVGELAWCTASQLQSLSSCHQGLNSGLSYFTRCDYSASDLNHMRSLKGLRQVKCIYIASNWICLPIQCITKTRRGRHRDVGTMIGLWCCVLQYAVRLQPLSSTTAVGFLK